MITFLDALAKCLAPALAVGPSACLPKPSTGLLPPIITSLSLPIASVNAAALPSIILNLTFSVVRVVLNLASNNLASGNVKLLPLTWM